jgi:hypothetical protein
MMRHCRHDHCKDDQRHPGGEKGSIALGRKNVAFHRPDHQREADAHGKRNRHARRVNSDDEENIRDIEEDAARYRGPDRGLRPAAQALQKRHAGRTRAPEREREQQGERKHANRVIPIEELKRPFVFAGQFLRVRPRPPTQHGDDAKQNGDAKVVNDKHGER